MAGGKVYLVGAGPGDPGLFTLKGREILKQADVIIYDYLANEALLEQTRENAEKIYVGKKGGHHTKSQEEINRLLIEKARNLVVVRLKGGDPFIFGRGGEEAQALRKAGIPFEVVPGVTSAIAVPAYAGIPLSHRDFTASIAFITGHEREDDERSKINWEALAKLGGTLVFLMGVKNLHYISDCLMAHGMPSDTPVAVIEWGTTLRQRTVTGTLDSIASLAERENVKPPAVIVVGNVVSLRPALNWFETKPLFGKRIVITRARAQASHLKQKLEELGANCIEFPSIEIVPPPSWDACDQAIQDISNYSWVIFTSVNGVQQFFKRLWDLGKDLRVLMGCRIGAIGPATATAIENRGIRVDVVPQSYRAEDLAASFSKEMVYGKNVLIPRALKARDILPESLRKMGANVTVAPVYATVPARVSEEDRNIMTELLKEGVHCITFTSSSTVRNFCHIMKTDRPADLLNKTIVACIGPVTAETARNFGINVHIVAKEYTINGLVQAILSYF
ncbi:MAG: uroporphyrinogen-III C-methyltransferase [Deltaproteobacteria bacterium]|nr:uroporphyrinogen-III C-methyltransferase [Deltaproteobacteria bacterium]